MKTRSSILGVILFDLLGLVFTVFAYPHSVRATIIVENKNTYQQ